MSFFFFISYILVGFSFIHISLFSFLSRVHPGGKLQFEREIRWVASKCVRVSQVYQKKNKHINEHVCLMYSPYQWIYKHHGGSRIRQDGKNEQMSVEKSLDAECEILKPSRKIVEDSTLVTSGYTSWLSQVEPLR